jgi:hypothetical protein
VATQMKARKNAGGRVFCLIPGNSHSTGSRAIAGALARMSKNSNRPRRLRRDLSPVGFNNWDDWDNGHTDHSDA